MLRLPRFQALAGDRPVHSRCQQTLPNSSHVTIEVIRGLLRGVVLTDKHYFSLLLWTISVLMFACGVVAAIARDLFSESYCLGS